MTLRSSQSLLITLLLLVVAVTCYFAGLVLPAALLFGVGIVAETAFWMRVLRRNRKRKGNS